MISSFLRWRRRRRIYKNVEAALGLGVNALKKKFF